jgi:hypothetical protein
VRRGVFSGAGCFFFTSASSLDLVGGDAEQDCGFVVFVGAVLSEPPVDDSHFEVGGAGSAEGVAFLTEYGYEGAVGAFFGDLVEEGGLLAVSGWGEFVDGEVSCGCPGGDGSAEVVEGGGVFGVVADVGDEGAVHAGDVALGGEHDHGGGLDSTAVGDDFEWFRGAGHGVSCLFVGVLG